MGKFKYDYEFINNFILSTGCKLITTGKISGNTKIEILCVCGNKFKTIFKTFFKEGNHHKCENCVNKIVGDKYRLSYDYVRNYIESFGCSLIDDNYVGNRNALKIVCHCGSVFTTTFMIFSRKTSTHSCQECAKKNASNARRLSFDYVINYIEKESNSGSIYVSGEYVSNLSVLKLRCKCGELYETNFSSFKDAGKQRCKKCSNQKIADSKKYSYDEVKKILAERDYILLDNEYKNANTKINVMSNDGYKYLGVLFSFIDNKEKNKFGFTNPYREDNIRLWIIDNNKPFQFISFEDPEGEDSKINLKCNNCDEVWDSNLSPIVLGGGCPYCHGTRLGSKNNLKYCFPLLCKEWSNKNENDPENYHKGSRYKAIWNCSQCNHEWEATISDRTHGRGCPKCVMSGGAKFIYSVLDKYGIPKTMEKTFPDLISDFGKELRYDFAVYSDDEKTKLRMLIEYDDLQHEKFIPFFHENIENFQMRQKYDIIKNEYAEKIGIKLIRIKSKDFKNIESILTKELNLTLQGKEEQQIGAF
jgi:hypothetical protein